MQKIDGPSPVKSQKFLPAVNHTKLRISMFTPELMEKKKHLQSCMKDESLLIRSPFLSLDLNGILK